MVFRNQNIFQLIYYLFLESLKSCSRKIFIKSVLVFKNLLVHLCYGNANSKTDSR